MHNIMLHQAVKEYKNIHVVHFNYPFDKQSNKYIGVDMHPGACLMAKAALAAKKQNNYWEMSSLLYENKPANVEQILLLSDKIGLDREQFIKDLNSDAISEELNDDINRISKMGVNATPTMIINGVQYVGVKPYYDLKKVLVKHGAK